MAYEMMVGLTVRDDAVYRQYREAMTPLLEEHGGGFRYDFVVSDVLKTQADHPINRVFAIYFRDRAAKDAFFDHADYKQVRARFFDASVGGTTILSEYERQ